jgi:hypothetical protein
MRSGGAVKKEEVVESIDKAGLTIHEANARAWNTAFNPTMYGWPSSIASIVAIPVLNMASIGHFVSAVVVSQISPSVFDTLSNLSPSKDKDDDSGGTSP